MSEDVLGEIQDKKALSDLGRMAYYVYKGAVDEGASPREALAIVSEYFAGMFKGSQTDEGDTT